MDESDGIMAELYIRTEDKVNPDLYLDVMCYKRGDVVSIVDDNWHWGESELNNAVHTIIKAPLVHKDDLNAFLEPEPSLDPVNISRTLQRRAFRFDLNNYNLQGNPILNSLNIMLFKVPVQPRIDPNPIIVVI